MMKLYKYTFGEWVNYGAAKDDADAFERRIAIDPQFHYVPVTIEEVGLEGYTISVEQNDPELSSVEIIDKLDKDGLKVFLDAKKIPFHHTLGEVKLRELALQHV